MRHLESQQSLPTLGKDARSLSALAKNLRLAADLTALRFKRT